MKKKKFSQLVLVLCASALMAFGASAATNLVAADSLPPTHAFVQTVGYFGDLVGKQTNGALTVTVRPDGVLGSDSQILHEVKEGRVAIVRITLGQLADEMRGAELASLPYLFRSEAHLHDVLQGPFGVSLDREFLEHGYVRLMYIYGGPRDLYCTKPIYGVSDFKDMRVRTLESKVFTETFRDLGAVPVELPIGKTADAFRNHQIDCAGGNVETYVSEELYRYAPYLMQDEHARIPEVLLMSKKVWDTLTPVQQNVLRASASETMEHMLSRWREVEDNAIKAARKAGAKIIPHEAIANDAIEEQAARFYNHVVKSDKDLEAIMKIVMTR
jgi:TRAP-type C4-dicarboxylate transport system substrate-binding protein